MLSLPLEFQGCRCLEFHCRPPLGEGACEEQHLGDRELPVSLCTCGALCLNPAEWWVASYCPLATLLLPSWALLPLHHPPLTEMVLLCPR